MSAVTSYGPGIPPGTVIVSKTPTKNKAAAEFVPRTFFSDQIQIDPAAIAAGYPNIDENEANLPGVLFFFMIHEAKHAWRYHNGQTGHGLCDEVEIQQQTAGELCYFIAGSLGAGGTTGALCDLYRDFRESFNNGLPGGSIPGGATTAWARGECSGPPPDDLGPCIDDDGNDLCPAP